jgi:Zn-dependent metalloprotease
MVKFKNYSKVPNYLRFSENSTLSEQEAIGIIRSFIKNGNSDLQVKKVQNNGDNSQTIRYYQTVSGYPIEFTALNLQVKNGRVSEVNGEILDNPQITPNFILSEAEALQFALNFVNAERYMWQEDSAYFPQGEQVIVPNKISFDKSVLP